MFKTIRLTVAFILLTSSFAQAADQWPQRKGYAGGARGGLARTTAAAAVQAQKNLLAQQRSDALSKRFEAEEIATERVAVRLMGVVTNQSPETRTFCLSYQWSERYSHSMKGQSKERLLSPGETVEFTYALALPRAMYDQTSYGVTITGITGITSYTNTENGIQGEIAEAFEFPIPLGGTYTLTVDRKFKLPEGARPKKQYNASEGLTPHEVDACYPGGVTNLAMAASLREAKGSAAAKEG